MRDLKSSQFAIKITPDQHEKYLSRLNCDERNEKCFSKKFQFTSKYVTKANEY